MINYLAHGKPNIVLKAHFIDKTSKNQHLTVKLFFCN